MVHDIPEKHFRRGVAAILSFGPRWASPLAALAADPAGLSLDANEGATDVDAADGTPLGGWSKRLTDIAIAIAGLVLAAPLLLLIGLVITATDRGPVLYAHGRVGFRGRPFQCYKFRSMSVDANALLADHLARDPEAAKEWRDTQKLRRDPRVTFVGHWLRKTSLDELPQLFNILRGDMSCVGPRPIIRCELERYGSRAGYYLRTRPGLTGLWQVTGRSSTAYESRVLLDANYVRSWSLWIDFVILSRTPIAVIRFREVC